MYKYVCVLSTNDYLDGVLVLNENLKHLKSKYPLLCIINENISKETRDILNKFNIEFNEMKANIPSYYDDSFRWKFTFDKLNIFSLTEYKKIVYLDIDFLILENIDKLFDIEKFSMVSDLNPNNYFCSALMVIKPNMDDYNNLINLFKEKIEKEENGIGDQDIINEYFDNINEIPIEYNFIKGIEQSLIDVYDPIKNMVVQNYVCKDYYWSENPIIIHYFGNTKPFMIDREFDDKYCYLYFYYLMMVRKKKLSLL